MKLVLGLHSTQKPLRPRPRDPHRIEFKANGLAILLVNEEGRSKPRRYFLEDFPQAWHPHPLPDRLSD